MSAAVPLAPGAMGPSAGFWQILACVYRKTRLTGVFLMVAVGLMLGLLAIAGGKRLASDFAPPAAAICLILLWWASFLALQAQNHPIAARLVPGQLRQLREVAVAVFLALSLLGGALLSRLGLPAPAWASATAFIMLALAVISRWPMLWLAAWIIPLTSAYWVPMSVRMSVASQVSHAFMQRPWLSALVTLALMSAAVWKLFQGGGPAHERHWRQATRVRQAVKGRSIAGKAMANLPEGRINQLVGKGVGWLRAWWTERLLATATPTPSSVMARVEIASNPNAHWSQTMGTLAVVMAGIAVVGGFVEWMNPAKAGGIWYGILPGFSLGLLTMLLNPALMAPGILHKRRRAQAVLLLVPGLPRGTAFNRLWARRQMWQFLICLGGGALLLWLLETAVRAAHHGGDDRPQFFINLGLNYLAIALPAGQVLWRDWSRSKGDGDAFTIRNITVAVLAMGAVGALGPWLGVSPWVILAASAGIAALLMLLRWRVVTTSPTFWPVGRWA